MRCSTEPRFRKYVKGYGKVNVPENATFQRTDRKLYVPVVTL